MQLNKRNKITGILAGATCVLLGSTMAHAEDKGLKVDTAFLFYQEKDRVGAAEPAVKISKTNSDTSVIGVKLVLDTLSGPSPSGAAPSDIAQTMTSPSGKDSYAISAKEIPLDDTFHDQRGQVTLSWDAPLDRLTRYNLGANISAEHDYSSVGFSGGLLRDFNKKNTTLSGGIAVNIDSINPEGGIPVARELMVTVNEIDKRESGNETKNVIDLLLGVTQVINAQTIMQFNFGLSQSSGYLNDPYKVVSKVYDDGALGNVDGRPFAQIYESRPDSRLKESVFWNTKYHLDRGDTVDLSYRYMTDDWGVQSHTLDFHYRWNINENYYLQPHWRYYQQTAADFYHHSLSENVITPEYLTADYRLAKFNDTTIGVKWGYIINPDSEWNVRVEKYQSKGDSNPSDAIGIQKNFDMYPDLDAVIFQVGYSFKY